MRPGAILLGVAVCILAGCADRSEVAHAESSAGRRQTLCNVNVRPEFSKADLLLFNQIGEDESDALMKDILSCGVTESMTGRHRFWHEDIRDSAFTKRKAALMMGRCELTYEFMTYGSLDGVSGAIYNVAYLFSVPRKALTYLKCADGVLGYAHGLLLLGCGAICSVVGMFVQPVVNMVCHPLETLSNLTIGLLYFGDNWGYYVANTNVIASIWDLIWGAMMYPLWQALTFWF